MGVRGIQALQCAINLKLPQEFLRGKFMTAAEGRLESVPHDETFVRKAEQTLFYSIKKEQEKKKATDQSDDGV